jgi:polar amino acid transport system substrate-binding protein
MNYLVGGQLQGWNVDVVRDVFERAGLEPDFQVQPMARALLTAKQQADCGCFPVVRSVEREDWFHWVGVISSQVGGFLALRDNPLQAQSLDDLRGRRIGVLNHDIRMEWLLRERFRMGAELELAPSQEANLRKLLVGRIDVWPIGLATARYLAEREGPDVLSRLRMVWRIPKGAIGGSAFTGNWLVLNPGVP